MESDRSVNRLSTAAVRSIRVPMALGAVKDGVDRGAEVLDTALRARFERREYPELRARLRPSEEVPVPHPSTLDGRLQPGGVLHLEPIAAACAELAAKVGAAIAAGELALVLGGDHAVSIGSIAGAAAAAERLGVLWIDAHADMNSPETSPSGHVHGMPLAVSLGRGPAALTDLCGRVPKVRPEDTELFGIRNLDPGERRWLAGGRVHYTTMARIDAEGFEPVVRATLDQLRGSGVDAVHVSFDVDVLDPLVLPGTGYPDWGGLTFREAARLLRLLREADLPVRSLDWVELNPALDPSGASSSVATELLAIALGEEVL